VTGAVADFVVRAASRYVASTVTLGATLASKLQPSTAGKFAAG
jgi:hypothetical protein